jgi:hypothetical protein
MEGCRFVGYNDEVVRVEKLVLQHHAREENGAWKGVHTEGGIWLSLFGLLMWDQIFDDRVPHVFQTRFQPCPLDLFTDSFFLSRAESIEKRLNEIHNAAADTLRRMVLDSWTRNYNRACVGVSWSGAESTALDLADIATFLGGRKRSQVIYIISRVYRQMCYGFTDFIICRELKPSELNNSVPENFDAAKKRRSDAKTDMEDFDSQINTEIFDDETFGKPTVSRVGQVRVCEVKSHNDSLSDQQKAWIEEMTNGGIDVCVMKVKRPK